MKQGMTICLRHSPPPSLALQDETKKWKHLLTLVFLHGKSFWKCEVHSNSIKLINFRSIFIPLPLPISSIALSLDNTKKNLSIPVENGKARAGAREESRSISVMEAPHLPPGSATLSRDSLQPSRRGYQLLTVE